MTQNLEVVLEELCEKFNLSQSGVPDYRRVERLSEKTAITYWKFGAVVVHGADLGLLSYLGEWKIESDLCMSATYSKSLAFALMRMYSYVRSFGDPIVFTYTDGTTRIVSYELGAEEKEKGN